MGCHLWGVCVVDEVDRVCCCQGNVRRRPTWTSARRSSNGGYRAGPPDSGVLRKGRCESLACDAARHVCRGNCHLVVPQVHRGRGGRCCFTHTPSLSALPYPFPLPKTSGTPP